MKYLLPIIISIVFLAGCDSLEPNRPLGWDRGVPDPILGTYGSTPEIVFQPFGEATFNGSPLTWYRVNETHYVLEDTYIVTLVTGGIFLDGATYNSRFLERQP